jgi:hypothetical protein
MSLFQPVKYCPVTGNSPLVCTEKGFKESCLTFRKMITMKTGRRFDYCGICQGEVPRNVTFREITKELQENIMSNVKKTVGKCQQCGEHKSLINHFDEQVCSMCSIVRGCAKSKPDTVLDALRKFGNLPAARIEQPVQPDRETLEENEKLKKTVAGLLEENTMLEKRIEQEEKTNKHLGTALFEARTDVAELQNKIKQLETLIAQEPPQPNKWCHSDDIRDTINNLAWKLADGVMAGTLPGVGPDDIRTLRTLL